MAIGCASGTKLSGMKAEDVGVRRERASDFGAIRAVNEAAFGRSAEADLVDRLRKDRLNVRYSGSLGSFPLLLSWPTYVIASDPPMSPVRRRRAAICPTLLAIVLLTPDRR